MKTKINKKMVLRAICGVVVLGLVNASYVVIDETEEGVVTTLGETDKTALSAGVHLKMPIFTTINKMPIGVKIIEMEGVTIPTSQNPNQPASANLTLRYSVIKGMSPSIRAKHGTIEKYIHNQTRQDLLSLLRNKGRKIKDTRELLSGDTLQVMQNELTEELRALAAPEGVRIDDVLIQEAVPHQREATRMEATRNRQEAEHTATSEATRKSIADNMIVATRKASKKAAAEDQEKEIAQATADAEANVLIATGEAEAVRLKASAEAFRNNKLSRSLTPDLIRMEELRVKGLEAGTGWNGTVPSSLTTYGDMGGNSPVFLKNLK